MSLNPNRAKAAATQSTQATSDSGGVIFRESARGVVGGHDLSRGVLFAISKRYRSGDNGEVAAREEYSVQLAQLAPRISAIMNFSVGRNSEVAAETEEPPGQEEAVSEKYGQDGQRERAGWKEH